MKNLWSLLAAFILVSLVVLDVRPLEAARYVQKRPEKAITVVIPSYNNSSVYKKNLDSLFSQKYSNYRVIYIDDASSDNTGDLVEAYVKEAGFEERVTLIKNNQRCGALKNLYDAIHTCDDDDIIVTYDGDDWFNHDQVLKRVNEAYSGKKTVWLTHGKLRQYPSGDESWCRDIPKKIVEKNLFRTYRCPSHLRTFYAWLFKKIELEDLLYKGEFYPMAWDLAMMYPMIEMAGSRHKFIDEVLYIYNATNPLNDFKQAPNYQASLAAYIRKQPPYLKLENRDSQPKKKK